MTQEITQPQAAENVQVYTEHYATDRIFVRQLGSSRYGLTEQRRERLSDTIEWLTNVFASDSPGFYDDLVLIDSTPVECTRIVETIVSMSPIVLRKMKSRVPSRYPGSQSCL